MAKRKKIDTNNLISWLLRLGLAFVFLYAGVSSLQHPLTWIGYLPTFLATAKAATTFIKLIAIFELVMAVWLVSGQYVRYAALLSALMMAGIVVSNLSQMIIVFRDVGLAFMALALAALPES